MSAAFQRARTAEQRAERAAAILEVARTMLGEVPLEAITLNALARRVGLSSSNVLRYYDSREAVLLALVTDETEAWLRELLERPLPATDAPIVERCAAVARAVAETMAAHPRFCELISVQAAVLERRVTADTALRFKAESISQLQRLADWQQLGLPELAGCGLDQRLRLTARSVLIAGALWAQSRASPEVAARLASHPELLRVQAPFLESVQETLTLLFVGAVKIGSG